MYYAWDTFFSVIYLWHLNGVINRELEIHDEFWDLNISRLATIDLLFHIALMLSIPNYYTWRWNCFVMCGLNESGP